MKIIKILISIMFVFFFSACYDTTPKCDDKVALKLLEELTKEEFESIYVESLNLTGVGNFGANINELANKYKEYLKNVKVDFLNFRTQEENVKYKYKHCQVDIKANFPNTPDELKAPSNLLKNLLGRELKDKYKTIVNGNGMEELSLYYRIQLSDDNKHVNVELLDY
ncbi:TPA: hypothetical protein ACRZSW_001501 [Campylobacter lari subsp. concheus]|uniref:hypothetical protein n=1 Tax=Campylobacter lari TaxID=201 RepID=UPI0021C15C99|nr:hypothetical protein [Campylobacter lari]